MNTKSLKKAREYERINSNLISDEVRPVFHLSSRIGWMNDPNGFSVFDGKFHLFYQYYPYDVRWYDIHWGHASSSDLINWEYLPAALAPENDYDDIGCFSGSALSIDSDEGSKHVLMYTAVHESERLTKNGKPITVQEQAIAIGDGLDYKKHDANSVITASDLPAEYNPEDFRDPKIFLDDDTYYALLVARKTDSYGAILLYSSKNLSDWTFVSEFLANDGKHGVMWECPDYVEIDGHEFVLMSIQDFVSDSHDYHDGDVAVSVLGEVDPDSMTFAAKDMKSLDFGFDFYAPQTTTAPDGRQIMIAWMQNWANTREALVDAPYYGQMTFPRELFVVDGQLRQRPVQEIANIYSKKQELIGVDTSEGIELNSRIFDLEITLQTNNSESSFSVDLLDNTEDKLTLHYNNAQQLYRLERRTDDYVIAGMETIYAPSSHKSGDLKIRILVDKFSVEIFLNDGAEVITALTAAPLDANKITLKSEEAMQANITLHDLA